MTGPLIGVGVPVWRGDAFVAETLESVLNQRGVQFKVVVSIDGADAESERACRPFASDARVQIIVQRQRLGWVKNTAAVLSAAIQGSEFACVQPHDDWIEPHYLGALLDMARSCPEAAVVFSDIEGFGASRGIVSQDGVTGSPMERQLSLLTRHYNALAYRGLIRGSALTAVPPISGNEHGDYACDTVWMARLARAGDLVRVPEVLYHKRYHANSAHAAWTTWRLEQKVAAWIAHCLDMLAEALNVAGNREDRRLLMDAARRRLVMTDVSFGPYAGEIHAMSRRLRRQMLMAFEAGATARSDIGPLELTMLDRLLRMVMPVPALDARLLRRQRAGEVIE